MFNLGSHPLNLALRFILEMASLGAVGIWGFSSNQFPFSYITGIGAPIILATIWGVFAVPNDPSRSGKTVIITAGRTRLIIEIIFFSIGSISLYSIGYHNLSYVFTFGLLVHYAISIDRIKWLLQH